MKDLFVIDILVGAIIEIFMILTNIKNTITLDAIRLVYLKIEANRRHKFSKK
jgi:hypothetical protein